MKPLEALRSWYEQLTARDRRIVLIAAALVAIMLLAGILVPLQRHVLLARDQVRQQQQDLDWMRRVAPTLAAAGPGSSAARTGHDSLVVLIASSAGESGLAKALTGSTPAGNGALLVQFQNADFNLLLGWLHRLSTQQGLKIEDATISGNGDAGVVNASLQLRPGA